MAPNAVSSKVVDFKYTRLADDIETKISKGIFRAGEKLPSIRRLQVQTGFSMTTVYQAYIELEKRGIIEPRLKSGFYVKPRLKNILPSPPIGNQSARPQMVSINNLVHMIHEAMGDRSILQLGGAVPSADLLPSKRLLSTLKSQNAAAISELITHYDHPAGSPELRRRIAQRMLGYASAVNSDDVVITNGCMDAIHLCLRAVAKPGDTIVVESPTFHCFLQAIEDLNMYALELPSDPEAGIDLERLEKAVDNNSVGCCLFISSFHNPLGYCMSNRHKSQLVALLAQRRIPIIEDDIYGDIYFGHTRPSPLKAFDLDGWVLYCSSFSKTLAPGLRIGWTVPGRFQNRVRRLKLNNTIASPSLNQHMINSFLAAGAYDRHLRKLRNALKNQVSNTAIAVARYFPAGTCMTAPKGGLMLWVQLSNTVDGLEVFHEARKRRISILPGILFSSHKAHRNCIRISCGNPWDDQIEAGIAQLGQIVTKLEKRKNAS